jgi:hypothetical protein
MAEKVINIRKKELQKIGYDDLEDWLGKSEDHVYIGRNMTVYVKGASKSKWFNPFPVKKWGLEKCLEMYEEKVRNDTELMGSLGELRGKTLGCWCKPDRCHGDVLLKLMKEMDGE